MSEQFLQGYFGLSGQVAVVTGGGGVLGSAMALGLAGAGAKVAVIGRRPLPLQQVVAQIEDAGGTAIALESDVTSRPALEIAQQAVLEAWGQLNILVNAAGGNVAAATIPPGGNVFDLSLEALEQVMQLNFSGTVLPSLVFGATIASQSEGGCIINVSSMTAQRAVSRVVGYSAAKSAVDNFTRWLAVELAQKYDGRVRVNAIAPGFFLGEQNRNLLLNSDGTLSERGQRIIEHTPVGRFGQPSELISTLLWLCGAGASFVNGMVIPVDGGFSSYSGI